MEKKINNGITIILSIVLFVVPILIIPNSDRNYNDLRIIVLLICGLALLIGLILKLKKIKFDIEDLLLIGFVIIAIISTIFSININQSIIGARNRYEGILTIITYTLIYYHVKNSFEKYRNLEKIGIIAYMIVCVIAIIQFYMPDDIMILPIFGKGAHGTLGNPNFMGSFISIILPFFILMYIIKNRKKYLLCSIIAFSVMLMCVARSVWIAFPVYIFIITIYVIIKRKKEYLKRLLIIFIAFLMSFSVIIISSGENLQIRKKINAMGRDFQIIRNEGITNDIGSTRIEIWRMTIKLIKKTPIIGCGVDCLDKGLAKLLPVENQNYIKAHHTYVDKAHNEYLQIAATMGVPALAMYLGFLIINILPSLKKMWKYDKMVILVVPVIGYLIQAFFNISTIGVAPIFWFMLGMLSKDREEYK